MWTYNYSNELFHHGIIGMKWGRRRYQNKDGSLTKAGKKRYNDETSSMSDEALRGKVNRMNLEKRYYNLTDKSGNSSQYIDKSIKIGKDSSTTVSNVSKLSRKDATGLDMASKSLDAASKTVAVGKALKGAVKRKPKDLSSMSDDELKRKVDRIDLERQYSNLKKETVTRGKTTAMDVLNVAGAVVALGASATGIALNIYNLRKKAAGVDPSQLKIKF